ncbi:MAG: hypothetical protein H6711_28075 [Myxococcales bacterium]|nr:hypothetical protein [Myxococcales bacterium]
MVSTSNFYDLIVVGSDLAGLAAASLVARRGKRVLVIPLAPIDGVDPGGPEPTVSEPAPIVYGESPPIRRVFEELGIWQQVRREREPIRGRLHLALPEHRLDLQSGLQNLRAELEREWPEARGVEAWSEHLRLSGGCHELWEEILASDLAVSSDGFFDRRALAKIAAQLPGSELDDMAPLAADHPLRLLGRVMLPWLANLAPTQLGAAAALRLAACWDQGPEDFAGGMPRLRAFLLDRLSTHAGEVKPSLRIAEILVHRGRVSGVAFFGKRDAYGCENLILADDPAYLLSEVVPTSGLAGVFGLPPAEVEVVAGRYVLHLDIDVAGVSPALDGIVVHLGETEGWLARHGIGTTYLRIDPTVVSDARRLTLTRIVAAGAPLDRIREEILSELDHAGILPFVGPHIRWSYSPHDGRGALDARGREISERPPDLRPTPMESIVARRGGEPVLGVGLYPHTTEIRNLFLASRLTLPGLGIEGELATALAVAGSIAAPSRGRGRPRIFGR